MCGQKGVFVDVVENDRQSLWRNFPNNVGGEGDGGMCKSIMDISNQKEKLFVGRKNIGRAFASQVTPVVRSYSVIAFADQWWCFVRCSVFV